MIVRAYEVGREYVGSFAFLPAPKHVFISPYANYLLLWKAYSKTFPHHLHKPLDITRVIAKSE
jgi:hypothetical protein